MQNATNIQNVLEINSREQFLITVYKGLIVNKICYDREDFQGNNSTILSIFIYLYFGCQWDQFIKE